MGLVQVLRQIDFNQNRYIYYSQAEQMANILQIGITVYLLEYISKNTAPYPLLNIDNKGGA